MNVRLSVGVVVVLLISFTVNFSFGEDGRTKKNVNKGTGATSFKRDIFPIIQKNCLPCHSEDNFNPSELAMDDYEMMKAGGKNGPIWIAGNSGESILLNKLSEKPSFGDRMPLNSKKKISEGRAKWLTEKEIKAMAKWIDEGAKNN
jgi:hypothetical protein